MEKKSVEKRMRVFLYVVVLVFLILVSRLAYIQLLQNDKFTTFARENRMRLIPINAPRGEIFDRYGVKLVGNQPVYTVYLEKITLVRLGQNDTDEMVRRLAVILGVEPQEIQQKINQQERLYEPIKLATKVPLEVVTRIEEQRLELPGVVIDVEPLREYPNGNLLSHVLGYVRQIDEEQLKKNKDNGYAAGDLYGQSGLENTYEQYLRGQDGAWQVEVDSMGRPVRDLGNKEPVQGNNLVLTIDHRVQKAAEDALARSSQAALREGYREARAGAAVALDVRTGAVLAMASYPGYSPDSLSGFISQKDYDEIFDSPRRPFLNRALSPYAPGSTYKMIVAIASLETNSITPQATVSDPGYFLRGTRFNCWKLSGHGLVNMIKAIKVSCDTYFYQLGLSVGIENIAYFSKEFGLGEKTGIELPGEYTGVVPDYDAKMQLRKDYLSAEELRQVQAIEQRYNELLAKADSAEQRKQLLAKRSDELMEVNWELAWHDYDTIISAIGQGDNRYNMLEMANYVATIANGGTLFKPYLVQRVVNPYDDRIIKENNPVVLKQANVSAQTLAVVRQGMREVTLPPDGTAYGFFAGLPPVAAKTGTAEVSGQDNHGLIVAYAPYDNPEIAVAVVMEFAGHGGTMAGPVAESMLAAYFDVAETDKKIVYSPE